MRRDICAKCYKLWDGHDGVFELPFGHFNKCGSCGTGNNTLFAYELPIGYLLVTRDEYL